MVTEKLTRYLSDHGAKYEVISHTPTYTAQETAQASHISGKTLIKCVVLKLDGKFVLLLESAHHKVNCKALAKWLGAKRVELAHESEFRSLFPILS